MRRVRKSARWGAFLVVCLLAIVGPATIVYWRHTVPLSQCSEVYRRYYDLPGIQAAFIRDKQINDTITADVTLLIAQDSATYCWLLREFGKSEELIEFVMSVGFTNNDNRFTGEYEDGIMAIFPQRRVVALFNTDKEQERKTIQRENFKETINIETENEKNF